MKAMYAQEENYWYNRALYGQYQHKFWGLGAEERARLLQATVEVRSNFGLNTNWAFVDGLCETDPDKFGNWLSLGEAVLALDIPPFLPRLKPLLITLPWALRQARAHGRV